MSIKSTVQIICALLLACSSVIAGSTLNELAAQLDSPYSAARLEAVRRIAIDYPGEGFEYLLAAASDSDDYVRERAIQALGQSGNQNAIAVVLAATADLAGFVRWRAVQALNDLGAREVIDKLAPLVDDPFWRVRVCTFQLLGEIARTKIVSRSPELAKAPGGQEIRRLLLAGLEDSDERGRLAAARALAVVHDEAAYQPLNELLDEGSLFTREEAALGLGDLGDKQAVEQLIEALENPLNNASDEGRDWARWGVAVALRQLTGQDFQINVEKWRNWLTNNPQ
jgi:HEAT repeat protein